MKNQFNDDKLVTVSYTKNSLYAGFEKVGDSITSDDGIVNTLVSCDERGTVYNVDSAKVNPGPEFSDKDLADLENFKL
jgi:hypothetical protein